MPKPGAMSLASPLLPFHGQWVIGDTEARPDPAFVEAPLSRATLFSHPTLPRKAVVAAGRQIGWLLGTPIDLEQARIVAGSYQVAEPPIDLDDWVEQHIYRLGGSWILVLDDGVSLRLYLDCAGSLSAVFDSAAHRVGATPETVLAGEYEERLLRNRVQEFEVSSDGWVSGDLTAHRGVRRLLANHYLDLGTWRAVRHWPVGSLIGTMSVEDSAEAIACAGRATIGAAVKGRAFMALTGGYDTRIVLSMSRAASDQLQFATIDAPGAARDVHLARRLARQFGLKHRTIPLITATEVQRAEWDRRVGHIVTGANRTMHPTLWTLGECYWIGGVGGEVGRGFLWMDATETSALDAVNLIDRLKLPRREDLIAAVEAWLAGLPATLNTLEILDLAFIELRNSSWAFGQAYSNPLSVKINPLNTRASYVGMLGSPPEARRGNALFRTVIERNWPELLSIPVNRYGDVRDRLEKVGVAIRRPDKAIRKVRQLLRMSRASS